MILPIVGIRVDYIASVQAAWKMWLTCGRLVISFSWNKILSNQQSTIVRRKTKNCLLVY